MNDGQSARLENDRSTAFPIAAAIAESDPNVAESDPNVTESDPIVAESGRCKAATMSNLKRPQFPIAVRWLPDGTSSM